MYMDVVDILAIPPCLLLWAKDGQYSSVISLPWGNYLTLIR